jgi:hypothetical protein
MVTFTMDRRDVYSKRVEALIGFLDGLIEAFQFHRQDVCSTLDFITSLETERTLFH